MLFANRPVVELQRPVFQGDVVDRKFWRFLVRRCLFFRQRSQLGQNVIDIVFAIAQMHQRAANAFHLQRINHRSQAQQALQLGVHISAADFELIALPAGLRQREIFDFKLQRPRLEIDCA